MTEPTAAPDAPMPDETVSAGEIVKRVGHVPISRVTHEILSDDELRRTWRTAAALAASGMWTSETGSAITPEVAFAKILVGRDLGLSPTRALMTVDLVKGAIMLRGVLLAGWIRQSPDYHYKTRDHDEKSCTVVLLGFPQDEPEDGYVRSQGRWWEVLGEETFTIADAQKQGLVKPNSAWTKTPKNMLLWRAISNAVKFYAPDLLGGVPVYVEGEIPTEPMLTAGSGDGSAPGVDLGPKVEAVIERAAKLGHAGLADRATAEMALMAQPPAVIERWVAEATAELDAVEAAADEQIADADVVPEVEVDTSDPIEAANRASVLREQASTALDEADDAKAAGDAEMEGALREQAARMLAEANAITSALQTVEG